MLSQLRIIKHQVSIRTITGVVNGKYSKGLEIDEHFLFERRQRGNERHTITLERRYENNHADQMGNWRPRERGRRGQNRYDWRSSLLFRRSTCPLSVRLRRRKNFSSEQQHSAESLWSGTSWEPRSRMPEETTRGAFNSNSNRMRGSVNTPTYWRTPEQEQFKRFKSHSLFDISSYWRMISVPFFEQWRAWLWLFGRMLLVKAARD